MALAPIPLKMGKNTLGNLKMASGVDLVVIISLMEKYMKVIGEMTNKMGLGLYYLLMNTRVINL